jgi:hypothetical protein
VKADLAESKTSRYGIELETARRLLGLPLESHPSESSSPGRHRDDSNYDELEEGWKLTDPMVSAMNKCDWLKRELQDESLRQLVRLVTAASNAVVRAPFAKNRRLKGHGDEETEQDHVLDRLKSELPHFRRFLDKLLVVAGVLERPPRREMDGGGDGEMDADLHDWLKQSVATANEPLTLKPLPRSCRSIPEMKVDEAARNMSGSESSTSSNESSSDDTDSSDGDSDQEE